jgi:hypothetical protein
MEHLKKIFLLIGQSNMAGRGRIEDVPALRHGKVFMYRQNRWMAAEEPLHTDKPSLAGIGLGMSFALDILKADGAAPIGLVPCAVGGTPLRRWMPGADLYEDAVATAKNALEKETLAGILWHQGEGDSGNHDDAANYGTRLRQMIQSLRSELHAENVPVIAGELGMFLLNHESCRFFERVNQELHELEGVVPAYACVSAQELTDNGDHLHFNAASLREFGIRYAHQYANLTA